MHIAGVPLARRAVDADIELSVVVTVSEHTDSANVVRSYRSALDALGMSYEVLCMANADMPATVAALSELAHSWPNLNVFSRRPWMGEDGELDAAYKRASGALILTLPGQAEIAPAELPKLFEAIGEADMVVCSRDTQPIGRARRKILKTCFHLFFGYPVSDVFSRVRLSRREVLDEVGGFGVRQHFTPVIAAERGYRVIEAQVRSADANAGDSRFVFKPIGHLLALLDALTLVVVLKFLHRPLRFFGSIGLPLFLIGSLFTGALVFARLFLGEPLADRPALIFSTLMIVLGIQIIALGLIGEIIIFANSRQIKRSKVVAIIRRDQHSDDVQEVPYKEDE